VIQPINPNNKLKPLHALFVGTTGSGKTTAIKQIGVIEAKDQVALFDPYKDYDQLVGRKVRRYTKLSAFAKALYQARAVRPAQGFKIAYSPTTGANPKSLEAFCQVVWGAGDGEHPKRLKVVLEELAKCLKTASKADGAFGEILTGGRKFGLDALCLFQRGQEVSKTIFGQCSTKWVGKQERKKDAAYLADELDFPLNEILSMPDFHYMIKKPEHGMGEFSKGKLRKLPDKAA
jgi:DNA helicase HerA-like ATPase